MAVTLDTALGTKAQASANSAALTTTAAAASGSRPIVFVGHFNNTGTPNLTLAGGSLTWTKDHFTSSGNLHVAFFSAPAAAGMASASVLTCSNNIVGTGDWLMGAGSFLGIDTVTPVSAFNSGAGSTAAWSGGAAGASSGDMVIGGAFEDGSGTLTSTPSGAAVELVDFLNAGQVEALAVNYKLSVAGADSADGTWSGAITWAALSVAYKAAGGAAAVPPILLMAQPAAGGI